MGWYGSHDLGFEPGLMKVIHHNGSTACKLFVLTVLLV